MQMYHSQLGRLTVLPMPELPPPAVSCHHRKEHIAMYDFSPASAEPKDLALSGAISVPVTLTASAIRQAIEGWDDLKPRHSANSQHRRPFNPGTARRGFGRQ